MKTPVSSEGDEGMTFEEMVKSNTWHNREELQIALDTLKPLFTPHPEKKWRSMSGWSWSKNPGWRSKYVNIQIDMRDGGFVLLDRGGERISLSQIKEQENWDTPQAEGAPKP